MEGRLDFRHSTPRPPDGAVVELSPLTAGLAMEQVGDYPEGVRYYKEALALRRRDPAPLPREPPPG
jgi:hypothetical protein